MTEFARQVVLVGAGHAHLHLASRAEQFRRRGAELVLIDPGAFWYSGLATGMLGGMYEPREDQVDPRALVERSGGRFIEGRVSGLFRERRAVRLESGEEVSYEAISFNLGSEVPLEKIEGAGERAWAVKPISNLWRLRKRLEERFRDAPEDAARVVVLGGGATGCEVAANVDALARRSAARIHLTLVARSERLLESHPAGASRRLERTLRRRGVEVELGSEVSRVEAGGVVTSDGRRFPAEVTIAAFGLRPLALAGKLGLPVGETGGLRIDSTLRSVGDDRVFACGDSADFEGRDLPKLGVFGVRQAPVLLANLLARLDGSDLRKYRPQKRYLAILNLGLGDALAMRGSLYWQGRASLWLKDRLDRRFLEKFR